MIDHPAMPKFTIAEYDEYPEHYAELSFISVVKWLEEPCNNHIEFLGFPRWSCRKCRLCLLKAAGLREVNNGSNT